MAAVFIQNVPFSMRELELHQILAEILHGHDFAKFSTGVPLNFHLTLFRDNRGGRMHRGQGILTLPTPDMANHFVALYGSGLRPTRGIKYNISNKPAIPNIVELISQTPYQSPKALEERQRRLDILKGELKLTAVQFGWICRDGAFSVEWDSQTDAALGSNPSQLLAFEEESREIRITIEGKQPQESDDISGFSALFGNRKFIVASKYSRIESITLEDDRVSPPAIIFTLSCPPTLEGESALSLFTSMIGAGNVKRTRVMGFTPLHESIIPFASLAIRIQCCSRLDVDQFLHKAKEVHLPPSYNINTPPVHRNLFAADILKAVRGWIAGLEWSIAFQCTAILHDLLVDPRELWDLRDAIGALYGEFGSSRASEILRQFRARLKILYWEGSDKSGSKTVEECLSVAKRDASPLHMTLRDQTKDDSLFNCLHVTCTPTRLLLSGPFPDQSNRVLRRYPGHHDCFVRVNFTDEESLTFRWDRNVDGAAFIHQRVGGVLKNGFNLAGRHFDFLAYSSSALREHAVWFCTPFSDAQGNHVTAASIRASLGDFHKVIKCPARYGARLSQAFSATEPSITLAAEELFQIPDITVKAFDGKESIFTDGIGTISRELANNIVSTIERRPGNKKKFWYPPSAFQVRVGGYKGVLSVDYTLSDSAIRVRPSMDKFDAPDSRGIEICSVVHSPSPMYLNRPLIMILETLGVPKENFLAYLDDAVQNIHGAAESLDTCARFMEAHGCGTAFRLSSLFLSLHRLRVGFGQGGHVTRTLKDPFLDRAIEFAANHALRELKHRAHIPVKDSYTLVGVVDEHGYLQPDAIFVCVREKGSEPIYLEGKVLITRSPQIHPGDVQFVNAIGRPPPGSPFQHEEFPNCVVFSSKGERSLPSMLAGGDLDGDIFNVVTNTDLFPPRAAAPAAYDPAVLKKLDRDSTIDDLAAWVVDYINSDILGLVSTQFLILADQSPQMAFDPKCIQLAALASAAVDFIKSGTPVRWTEMPQLLYNAKPDWSTGEMSNPGGRGDVYESKRAIGELYRRINLSDAGRKAAWASREARKKEKERMKKPSRKTDSLVEEMELLALSGPFPLHDPISQALLPVLQPYIDAQASIPTTLTADAGKQLEAYATELRTICATTSLSDRPLSEEEVLVGTIATNTSQPRRRTSLIARLRDQSSELVKRVLLEIAGKAESQETQEELEKWLLRGWAAWQVSVSEGDNFGARSFGWVALSAIFEAVRAIEVREEGIRRT